MRRILYTKTMIVGIDEVGRGPWAGPLVVGAVVLGCEIEGLTDSKKLTKKRREELNVEILDKAASVGLGWVHADELDELGISASLTEATKRALRQINVPFYEIIIDGTVNLLSGTTLSQYVTTMKKADLLVPSVSAASIVAKVARDAFMAEQAEYYPEYGFAAHVGYGTAAHRAAIAKHGVMPLHRLSFAPLAKYAEPSPNNKPHNKPTKPPKRSNLFAETTKELGDRAEDVVAEYLQKNGHEIVARNWKTKFCEIDIVSQKDDTTYFTEVKYRKNAAHGDGLAAITPKKQRQMRFAAELYMQKYPTPASPLLAAAAVTGPEYELTNFIMIES